MGLDNGIILKIHNENNFTKDELNQLELISLSKRGNNYELCYWRKCYNIRRFIFDLLGEERDYACSYKCSLNQAKLLKKELRNTALTKEWWELYNISIWQWYETAWQFQKKLIKQNEAFGKALKILEKHNNEDDYEIYFYDSY